MIWERTSYKSHINLKHTLSLMMKPSLIFKKWQANFIHIYKFKHKHKRTFTSFYLRFSIKSSWRVLNSCSWNIRGIFICPKAFARTYYKMTFSKFTRNILSNCNVGKYVKRQYMFLHLVIYSSTLLHIDVNSITMRYCFVECVDISEMNKNDLPKTKEMNVV